MANIEIRNGVDLKKDSTVVAPDRRNSSTSIPNTAWVNEDRNNYGYRQTATATVTIANTDNIVGLTNTDTVNVVVNMPAISTAGKFSVTIKDEKLGAKERPVVFNADGADLIEGFSSLTIASKGFSLDLYNDGVSKWFIK